MIRSGYLALRMIADFYDIAPEHAPHDESTLSIGRHDFDRLWERLERGGIRIDVDQDQAWADFVGWRVNYESALVGLKRLVGDVPSHWSRDEMPNV
jgi:hypothetical protein